MSRLAAPGFATAAVAWVTVLIIAPFALRSGMIIFALAVYQAGSLICHQLPERSFHLAGAQLPVCARCFGLYASGAAGALLACVAPWPRSARASHSARLVLVAAALPTIISFAAEWLGLLTTTSLFRAMAAIPLGAATGWIIGARLRR